MQVGRPGFVCKMESATCRLSSICNSSALSPVILTSSKTKSFPPCMSSVHPPFAAFTIITNQGGEVLEKFFIFLVLPDKGRKNLSKKLERLSLF